MSIRSHFLAEVISILFLISGSPSVNAEPASALRRCLDEAADAANRNNCASKLQQQDENIAASTADREAYRACMEASAQETQKMTAQCQKEEADRQAAREGGEERVAPDPAGQAPKATAKVPVPTARPKDPAKAPTDTTPKTDKAPTATTTPKSTTSVASAQSQIDNDMNQCQNYQSQAQKCCGNPMSCAGSLSQSDQRSLQQMMQSQPSQGQSMTEYCNQMKQQSANQTSVNNGLAAACSSPQQSCSSTCNSMGDKYINLANQNLGTDLESLYSSAAQQFYNAGNSCGALASRASQLASQGINGGNTNGMSQACQQSSASNPLTSGPNGNPVPTSKTQATLDATINCQANPNSAECQNQNKEQRGTAGFDTNSAGGQPKFDVADVSAPSRDYFGNNQQQAGTPAKNGTVANNTGGGVGGGGSSTQATLGGNARGGKPGSPGYTTDIMQGTMSGGGYNYGSNSSGSGLETNDYGNYRGQRRAVNHDKSGLLGMDLRQFLPGGTKDPRRALAGYNGHSEINSKEEDIWKRISVKIVEKCKLGVLWRCE